MAWKLLKNGGIIIFDGWCLTANTHMYNIPQKGSCHADYQWHQITSISIAQSPKRAIDAFLDVFSEVWLVQQHAALSPAYGTHLPALQHQRLKA